MELSEFNGPYFLGQEPKKCGHFEPDVVIMQYSLNGSASKVIETTFCFKCGIYDYSEVSLQSLDESTLRELAEKNVKEFGSLEKLAKIREEKLKSFLPGSDW